MHFNRVEIYHRRNSRFLFSFFFNPSNRTFTRSISTRRSCYTERRNHCWNYCESCFALTRISRWSPLVTTFRCIVTFIFFEAYRLSIYTRITCKSLFSFFFFFFLINRIGTSLCHRKWQNRKEKKERKKEKRANLFSTYIVHLIFVLEMDAPRVEVFNQ